MVMSQPRRSPRGDERKRDPERTRERIIEAAVTEFSEHGFAGARISAIAARAGVNQQLISYYFDGKEGLYRAIQRRWESTSGSLRPERPLAETLTDFLHLGATQRAWARLLAWEGLADTGSADDPETDTYFSAMVDDLRRRQEAGELAPDLDPAHVLVMLFAATLAPTLLPQIVRRVTGQAADSPGFLNAYAEQLGRLVASLASTSQPSKGTRRNTARPR
jgi:TetR/AcrR family transcriptional regulator